MNKQIRNIVLAVMRILAAAGAIAMICKTKRHTTATQS